jgi:hypothetical protein
MAGDNGGNNGHSQFDMNNPENMIIQSKMKADIEDVEGKVSTGDAADGTFTRVTPMTTSFLHRLATVDDNYDNEIKTGFYSNIQEARLFASALYEAEYLGEDPRPIKLIHMAGNAREKGGLINIELDALGRSTYAIENKSRTKGKSKSPLS